MRAQLQMTPGLKPEPGRFTSTRSPGAYTAAPLGPARATVVVLHAWWGLTDVVTGVCDDLAELGYVAVAPDLYAGKLAATPEETAALLRVVVEWQSADQGEDWFSGGRWC